MPRPARRLQGARVRELRIARGEKATPFARRVPISIRHLHNLEGDYVGVSEPTIVLIARALEVSVDDITEPVDDEPHASAGAA